MRPGAPRGSAASKIEERDFFVEWDEGCFDLSPPQISAGSTTFLASRDLTVGDIGAWVSHPGGPKVIEAISKALELPDAAPELTWRSLSEVGNRSPG